MKTATILPALVLAALLPGCAWLKLAPPGPPEAAGSGTPSQASASPPQQDWGAEAEEVRALLAYYQRMLGVSADDLRKEFTAVNQVFNRDKTESERLKLTLLLSIPNAPFRDDARLMMLLETSPVRNEVPESPRRQLLTLLTRLSAERLRLLSLARDEQKKLDAQVKEEQRRSEEQQKRAEEEQKRADDLQQKLDKLLAIERELRRGARRPN